MVRLFGTVCVGTVIGIGLAFGIGHFGVLTQKGAQKGDTSVVVLSASVDAEASDSTQLLVEVPPDRSDLPTQFHLWREGYAVGQRLDRWSDSNLDALAAYLTDWGLPAPEMDDLGQPIIASALAERLSRRHEATRAQWVATNRPDCKVWVAEPQPRMSADWSGACVDGMAHGQGTLILTFIYKGARAAGIYQGGMLRGMADGQGTTVTKQGLRYEGGHRDGLFHGQGVLGWDEGDEDIYRGAFRYGFPHGQGNRVGSAPTVQGQWRYGCFDQDGVKTWVLRHAIECGADKSTPPSSAAVDPTKG